MPERRALYVQSVHTGKDLAILLDFSKSPRLTVQNIEKEHPNYDCVACLERLTRDGLLVKKQSQKYEITKTGEEAIAHLLRFNGL